MAEQPVPFLRAGDKVLNTDGTVQEWFRNAWNTMVERTGTETQSTILGIINGQQEIAEQQAADRAAAVARDAALATSTSGGAGSVSNGTSYSGGVTSGTTWTAISTVPVTPSGAGGDYTISVLPDEVINGHLSSEAAYAEFDGDWRVVEELTGGGTVYTLDSGTFMVIYTPEVVIGDEGRTYTIPESWAVAFTGLPSGLIAANEAAAVNIRLEVRQSTGETLEITAPGLSGAMSVTWSA